jgi:alpha-1,6-mannosyltransferase
MGLWVIIFQSRLLMKTVLSTALALALGIGLSLSIDSFFWRRIVWPELEVLLFNTVENRSSDWGVSPWHWYFSVALPKLLMGELVLVICGLFLRRVGKGWVDSRLLSLSVLVFTYTILYSFLPHKELRFLFPVVPGFSVIAAMGLIKL